MYTQIFVCIYLCKCENMCICKYVHLCICTYICTHVKNDDPKGNVAMKLLLKVLVMTASYQQAYHRLPFQIRGFLCVFSFFRALST